MKVLTKISKRKQEAFPKVYAFFLLFLLIVSNLKAVEPWPATAEWVPIIDVNWSRIQDISDFNQGYIDIVNDIDNTSAYYWSSGTSLFMRVTLKSTPLRTATDLRAFAWFLAVDVNEDNFLDWTVMVGGISNTLTTYYNPGLDDDPEVLFTSIDDPVVTGDVRVVPAGYTVYPNAVYLDFQVKYTSLQAPGYDKNITPSTLVRFIYSTSTTEQVVIKDALGPSSSIFDALSNSQTVAFGNLSSYGYLFDDRDPDPLSSGGTWFRTDTLFISGSGWPPSTSSVYNGGVHNARIVDDAQNIIWSGLITSEPDGKINSAPVWQLPNTIMPGVYGIQVESPLEPGVFYLYDTFTASTPVISITKTAGSDSVSTGSIISYSLQVINTGTAAGQITLFSDLLPDGFTYAAGTTSGITTDEPVVAGQQISWNGLWTVAAAGQPGDTVSLNFDATASTVSGLVFNNGSVGGANFIVLNTGNTAPVQVTAPVLILTKSVDNSNGSPGDTLTYTVTYANAGDDDATFIFILEQIPGNTTYLTNSAAGTGITVTYSHDSGQSYDSSQTAPVTHLTFQRLTALPAGQSDTISFKVLIN